MKKIFMTLCSATIIATMVMGCASKAKELPKAEGDIDTLSYAIGVSFGMSTNQQFGILELDQERVKWGIVDFVESGNVEDSTFLNNHQKFMQFMMDGHVQEYARAKFERDAYEGDKADTLPALPELFNAENTRDNMSYIIGQLIGADVKMMGNDKLNNGWLLEGYSDALNITDYANMDESLKVTMNDLNAAYIKHMQDMQKREYEKAMAEAEQNKQACAEWLAEVEKMEGVKKTESGLLYRIDREGTGAQATEDSDVVLVNYEGKVRTGEIFDSSYEREEPISFPLNGVIKGWTEGLKLVKAGGQITLWIPSDLAYGDQRRSDVIGPGEALEFKVELLEVNPEK